MNQNRLVAFFSGLGALVNVLLGMFVALGYLDWSGETIAAVVLAVTTACGVIVAVIKGWHQEPVIIALAGSAGIVQTVLLALIATDAVDLTSESVGAIVAATTAAAAFLTAVLRPTVGSPNTLKELGYGGYGDA